MNEPLLFELGKPGRRACTLPRVDVPTLPVDKLVPAKYLRQKPAQLPEVSEPELVRHFTRLSQRNVGVDSHFYPLGSCTMKYNPKVNEEAASLPGFARIHPYLAASQCQGALALLHEMQGFLAEISGMDAVSLQPSAGAQGEMTALLIVRAYHSSKRKKPDVILVPDTAHGTNPASAAMAGFQVQVVKSDRHGQIDLQDLLRHLNDRVAALMLTNPNTLGLFEKEIATICDKVHKAGGLVYYDGANLNAVMGKCRPGDMGVDLMHFNLHKTFSTPHGGGGPGSGPIGVKKSLEPFLPLPAIEKKGGVFELIYDRPQSIGRVRSFLGNFGIIVRAYAYILSLGPEGLKQASEQAVLNANYMLSRLREVLESPYPGPCKHEFVLSARLLKEKGIRALDIAKRLLDYGFHAPTVYFPLIVEEALMIEPTETESKETLESFIEAIKSIVQEANEQPQRLHDAPLTTPVSRLDEVAAARQPNLRYRKPGSL